MLSTLIEDVRRVLSTRPTFLLRLIDQSVIDTLGLTHPEVVLLCALLVNEGRGREALATALNEGLKKVLVESAAQSLAERGLITRDGEDPTLWHFDGAEQVLRMQVPEEVEVPEENPPEPPSTKLVLRSLRHRVMLLARQGTPVGGLANVFSFVFGGVPAKGDFAILGMMIKLLGREKAALLMLEFAHQEMQRPLHDLIPIARAKAAQFRPADAPDENEQQRYMAAIAAKAKEKRGL